MLPAHRRPHRSAVSHPSCHSFTQCGFQHGAHWAWDRLGACRCSISIADALQNGAKGGWVPSGRLSITSTPGRRRKRAATITLEDTSFGSWSGCGIISTGKAVFRVLTTDLQIFSALKCFHWKLFYNNYKTIFYSSH